MNSPLLLSHDELRALSPALLDPVEYRKSGLSLNHIIGCPLECAYCIRHIFDNFQMKHPRLLMSDDDAVSYLLRHPYFRPHVTPLQIFNRATDPFLPSVKPHTFAVADRLASIGLTNHLLIITRYKVLPDDCERLNNIPNLKVTLLITYSGIDDSRIEPIDSKIAAQSLRVAFRAAKTYRTILYWRPIISMLNDSDEHLERAMLLSDTAHATVFTGLFYRDQIASYFRDNGIPEPYNDTARRKILPKQLDERVVNAFKKTNRLNSLFRKTSCAVSYAHGLPDYNGHYGIPELCDICPSEQVSRCRDAWKVPALEVLKSLSQQIGVTSVAAVDGGAVVTEGLDEPRRYFMQHHLGFQVHDKKYPHLPFQHGRAPVGWSVLEKEPPENESEED